MASDGAPAHGKVAKLYKEECVRRGESASLNGRSVNAKTYREIYGREFVGEVQRRLRRARDGAGSSAGTVVPLSRPERVDEAFYARFPELRPSKTVAEAKPCEACAKTKHASGQCQDHRPRKATRADEEYYRRNYESPAARRAAHSGRAAAAEVEITGVKKSTTLGESGPTWTELQLGS